MLIKNQLTLEKCYVHKIFKTNSKWLIVTSGQKRNFSGKFKLELVVVITYHLKFVVKNVT